MAEGGAKQLALVVGHSFVVRLDRSGYQFRLSNEVVLSGHSGLHCHQLASKFYFRPGLYTVVYLEIGSNDLCNHHVTPDALAQDILIVANKLLHDFYVKHVIIGRILFRHGKALEPTAKYYCPNYNQKVHFTNEKLEQLTNGNSNISCSVAKGLNNERFFEPDGIH